MGNERVFGAADVLKGVYKSVLLVLQMCGAAPRGPCIRDMSVLCGTEYTNPVRMSMVIRNSNVILMFLTHRSRC